MENVLIYLSSIICFLVGAIVSGGYCPKFLEKDEPQHYEENPLSDDISELLGYFPKADYDEDEGGENR